MSTRQNIQRQRKKNNQAEDASDITSADLPKLNQTEIYSRKI